MPSVLWLQAIAIDALKQTEYHAQASQIPYNREMLCKVQWSLYHSPLRKDHQLNNITYEGRTELERVDPAADEVLLTEANENRRRYHHNTVQAFNVLTALCKKMRLPYRQ